MRKPLELHDLKFKTQQAAMEWCKKLLAESVDHQRITGVDHDRLKALLHRHPQYERKWGDGVDYFYTAKVEVGAGVYRTRCFHFRRMDGTGDGFSYPKCVRGKGKSLLDAFREAGRNAVVPQTLQFKVDWFNAGNSLCSETGVPIKFETSHVDHMPPWTFNKICEAFVTRHGVSADWISPNVANQYGIHFGDDDARALFVRFHDERAKLQVISARQNMSHGSKTKRRVEEAK